MIQVSKGYFLLATLAVLALGACLRSGCGKQGSDSLPSTEGEMPEKISEFPRLSFDNLSQEQKTAFVKILNDEICPCGCPRTFAQCLTKEKECSPAKLLAQWTLDHLRSQTPERSLFEAVSQEINKGYTTEPLSVNTDDAHHKGQTSAPITIIEFADFECPACKHAAKAMAHLMRQKDLDIQLYFMHYPLPNHPHAEGAAVAAEAAARQGKFWEMHDLLFNFDGSLNETALKEIATQIFDKKQMTQFEQDLKDPKLLAKVQAQKDYAKKILKLNQTPTFLFNGRPYHLSLANDGFLLRIALEKARDSIRCDDI